MCRGSHGSPAPFMKHACANRTHSWYLHVRRQMSATKTKQMTLLTEFSRLAHPALHCCCCTTVAHGAVLCAYWKASIADGC